MASTANLQLHRHLTLIAAAVSAATVVVITAAYMVTAHQYESHRIQAEAELLANRLSRLVYVAPDAWLYQQERIVELVGDVAGMDRAGMAQHNVRVLDLEGNVVTEVGMPVPWPSLTRTSGISDGFRHRGAVELTENVRHIWLWSIVATAIGIGLAAAVFLVLRVLPLRALLRHEAALRQSEEQHRLITDALPVLIGYVDARQRYRFANKVTEDWFRRSRTEIIGQPLKDLLPPATLDEMRPQVERALAGEGGEFEGQLTFAETGPRHIRAQCIPHFGTDEQVSGFFVLIEDITMQKESEERLRQAQKFEAIGQLTGGIAHDFNNLLGVILGNVELLEERVTDDEMSVTLAKTVSRAAVRGAELTQRLLAFARKQALTPKATDVNALVVGMSDMLRRTVEASVNIDTELAEDLPDAYVDPGQLENAILNLVINARDAMPGGGTLKLSTAGVGRGGDNLAIPSSLRPGRYVTISVSDDGTGMAPDVVARAFDPFFTTKEVGRGSGLGLSMVYGFAKQSRGHVVIETGEGQGTTVRVYLPSAGSDARRTDGTMLQGVTIASHRAKVLVVEDDSDLRKIALTQLETMGFETIEAEDGPTALSLLADCGDIDLLFTDVILPGGMNGVTLAERAQLLRPQLRVLYTSGYTKEAIAERGRLAEACHLLAKPYRRAELAAMINEVLSDWPGRQAAPEAKSA